MESAEVEVLPDPAALAHAAAERFAAAAEAAIRARGVFVAALSGGSTPRRTYQRMASEPLASRVMWSRVHFLWGDERCVPPDHAESNYRMARESLLDQVAVPAANVHRIRGEDDPLMAATRYETTIRALLKTPTGPPQTAPGTRIDFMFLGLGEDGHTASIFPGSAAVYESVRWVLPEYAAKGSMWRVTVTPAVINAVAEVVFVVEGKAKADAVRGVIEGPRRFQELPAQVVAPPQGHVHWLLDAKAAAGLPDA